MKLLIRLLFWAGIFTLSLTSCSSNDLELPPSTGDDVKLSNHIKIEDSRKHLSKILDALQGKTRSGLSPIIDSGVAIGLNGKPITRNESEDDAWFYYFTIDHGDQFALMSARTELPELLAIGNGTPSWENVYSMLPEEYRWDINQIANDSITGGIGTITDSIITVRGESVYTHLYDDPLVLTKWGQLTPFNAKCPPRLNGKPAPTCCVVTAFAQMFTAQKCRPISYLTYTFDWDLMTSCPTAADLNKNKEAAEQVATLMFLLGKPYNINVNYNLTKNDENFVSEATTEGFSRTLYNWGFSETGNFDPYERELVENELRRGYPVIMWGEDRSNPKNGHTWIIQGMLKCVTPIYHVWANNPSQPALEDVEYEIKYYFNINWGWEGTADGYYLCDGFNASAGPDLRLHKNERRAIYTDFNHGRQILINVKK